MDQIVQQVVDRTGISHEQAQQAVQVVMGFLREKLPAPVASQVDSLLGGQPTGDVAQQAMGALGGMFGNK